MTPAPRQQQHPRQNGPRGPQDSGPPIAADALAKAVRHGIDNEFIKWAEQFARDRAEDVTKTQIRSIYGTVKKLEMSPAFDLPGVLLLKPRLMYAVKRKSSLRDLALCVVKAIDAVDEAATDTEKRERFARFCKGLEALVAYHRYYGKNK